MYVRYNKKSSLKTVRKLQDIAHLKWSWGRIKDAAGNDTKLFFLGDIYSIGIIWGEFCSLYNCLSNKHILRDPLIPQNKDGGRGLIQSISDGKSNIFV